MRDAPREVPPTAGLPLSWRDFLPTPGRSLETGLAAFLGLHSVQIECSGTAALIVALTALQRMSARRSVVVPAYTCPLVVLAIARCGLRPVLCDLRENHFDLDARALAAVCGDDTLAIVVTHLGGRIADVPAAIEVARRVGARVIEDAAQALGATRNGQALGTLGDAGFYSLAVGKGLTLYEGGVLTTQDAELREQFRRTSAELAPYRAMWELRRLLELAGYAVLYRPYGLRWAYGLPLRRALRKGRLTEAVGDEFSAEIPLHQVGTWRRVIGANALTRLPAFAETIASQAAARKGALATIPGVRVLDDPEGGRGMWPFFMVLMPTREARDAALARLWTAGLGVTRLFIHALPDYPYLAGYLGKADVPRARDFASRLLTVSNSPWLSDGDFQRVASVIAESVGAPGARMASSSRLTA